MRYIWGAQGLPVQVPAALESALSPTLFFPTGYRVFMVALVAIAVIILFLILKKTRLGMRIRAGTLDLEMVSALGVDVRILRNLNFGLGIFFAGLAGVLAAGMLGLTPTIGDQLIMPSFVAVIVGGLTANADRHVGELSHGDQRSTEIMMALALRPKLLLLDEPAAGMGSQETYDTAVLIRKLHRTQKLTIVLVEHDMRVIFNLADRITVLTEGEVLEVGTPDEIAASEKVQVAYLGEKREGA